MPDRVLLVDDEQRVLDGYRRNLGRRFDMEFAPGPAEALTMIEGGTEFTVVVSDLQMPGMNGIDLLSKIRELSPDTIRMMLTGQADLNASIQAVNEGRVFRFLTKPCPADELEFAINDALEQYHLVQELGKREYLHCY